MQKKFCVTLLNLQFIACSIKRLPWNKWKLFSYKQSQILYDTFSWLLWANLVGHRENQINRVVFVLEFLHSKLFPPHYSSYCFQVKRFLHGWHSNIICHEEIYVIWSLASCEILFTDNMIYKKKTFLHEKRLRFQNKWKYNTMKLALNLIWVVFSP